MLGLVLLAVVCTAAGWLLSRGRRASPPPERPALARANRPEGPRPPVADLPRPARTSPASGPATTAEPAPRPAAPPAPVATVSGPPPEATPVKPPPPAVRAGPSAVTFRGGVLPILQDRCVSCHGASKRKGRLDVRTVAALLEGGKNGPAVTFGSLDGSTLWDAVESNRMPPGRDKLSAAEKRLLREWILSGSREPS